MKRVVFTVFFCIVFAVPSFAAKVYLTSDNYMHIGSNYSLPEEYECEYTSSDNNWRYNPGITFGINVYKLINIESSLSIVSGSNTLTDGICNVMVVFQEPFTNGGSGFRPYIGIGEVLKWGYDSVKAKDAWSSNSQPTYTDVNLTVIGGGGLASKAGVRYYNGHFLIRIGAEFNVYSSSIIIDTDDYNTPETDSFVDCSFKLGFNVGVIF